MDSQGELARLSGTPRTTVSAYLRLLGLDEEVRAEALTLSDGDERVAAHQARRTPSQSPSVAMLDPVQYLRGTISRIVSPSTPA